MLRTLSLAAAVLTFAAFVPAQTLYGISAAGPLTSAITQMTGPPGGACAYPNGPLLGGFPTFVVFGCPTVGFVAPPPAILGDVAHNHLANVIWATNGPIVSSYTPAGVPISSFPTPPPLGPLTGLGFNSAAGILWMTDGILVAGVFAPAGGCGPPILALPPFPSPSPGMLTDIEWDPFSGTLFGCDVLGFVTNMTAAGAIGPFGIFPVLGGCPPPLAAPLQGLAVDTATPSVLGPPLTLVVTDGFSLHRITPPGAISPPTFYAPFPCTPVVGGPINGLCFTLHGITYGAGCNSMGFAIPTVTLTGDSTTPGALTVTLGAAPALGTAWVVFNTVAACPPLPFKGCSMYAAPVFLFGPFPIPAAGTIALPLAIPPLLPIGAEAFGQWICKQPVGGWALSPGFEFTFGNP